MTSKERLQAAMKGEPVDRMPFAPLLAYFWEARPRAVREAGQLAFLRSVGADPLWRCSPGAVTHDVPGLKIRTVRRGSEEACFYETPIGTLLERFRLSPEGATRYLVEHAVKGREDYRILASMEENTRVFIDAAPMRRHFEEDGREGLSLGNPIHVRHENVRKTAFQSLVEHWVGTEKLIYDLFDHPEEIDLVLEPMRERNREAVRLSAGLDEYDWFLSFEDSSTQNYSPDMYSTYIAPELTEWARILSDGGKEYVQHACGHLRDLLPALREQGSWGVESLTPPETGNISVAETRKALGPEFGIIGGLEPVKLANLDPQELPAYVDEVLAENAGGRFILSNADSCPPEVEPEKFRIIADHLAAI